MRGWRRGTQRKERGGDRWEGGRNCCHAWDLALKAEGVHQKSVQWAIHAQMAFGVQKDRTYLMYHRAPERWTSSGPAGTGERRGNRCVANQE